MLRRNIQSHHRYWQFKDVVYTLCMQSLVECSGSYWT